MTWQCAAIDHGLTVFSFDKIGPCTFIDSSYLKPISIIRDPNRFADLKTAQPPQACHQCVNKEKQGIASWRQEFNRRNKNLQGLQFVDIRNSNLCNLKCRYCGPHFSSQWASELSLSNAVNRTPIDSYSDLLFTESLHWMYFTGGEPLILSDHWAILDQLIEKNLAKNISLLYSTNLTTIRYKDKDIFSIWEKFKSVTVMVSIDAVGRPLECIRSGVDWAQLEQNIDKLLNLAKNYRSIKVRLSPVISVLNIWFIDEFYNWATAKKLAVDLNVLSGPDYLCLNVIPDELQCLVQHKLDLIKDQCNSVVWQQMSSLVQHNVAKGLFLHTLAHMMFLDKIRNENLLDVLPREVMSYAQTYLTSNREYQ